MNFKKKVQCNFEPRKQYDQMPLSEQILTPDQLNQNFFRFDSPVGFSRLPWGWAEQVRPVEGDFDLWRADGGKCKRLKGDSGKRSALRVKWSDPVHQ